MISRADSTSDRPSDTASALRAGKLQKRSRLRRWRGFKDGFARVGVATAGVGVIGALALIFVYLFSEVAPLLEGASIDPITEYGVPGGDSATELLRMERYDTIALRAARDGTITFFRLEDGDILERQVVNGVSEDTVTSFAWGEEPRGLLTYGLDDGRLALARYRYEQRFANNVRQLEPQLLYPMAEAPIELDPAGQPLVAVAAQQYRDDIAVAGATADGRLLLTRLQASENLMTGETEVRRQDVELPRPPGTVERLFIGNRHSNLYAFDSDGLVHYYNIQRPTDASIWESVRVVPEGESVTAADFLLGTVSLIVGASDGSVVQWMPVRDEDNRYHLRRVRDFQSHGGAVRSVTPEYGRRGFITRDADGELAIHYATSSQTVLHTRRPVFEDDVLVGLSPANQRLMVMDDDSVSVFRLRNRHPEISFSALWQKVWYEGRSGPDYVWQASSGSNEFEAKFSLMPLTLGTIKAAFYAMLFAMPLAVLGAIYSAYFMTPRLRNVVKPSIEIMEALPTVILGFLAGLWFAPFAENNLPAIFSILLLMPVAFLAFAWAWSRLPRGIRMRLVPEGWEMLALVPVALLVGWACVSASPFVEIWLFDGSMRQWLTDVGITYDQRNALVVGVAMGFAVIPTIFSIAEDAIFNVPKHLTQGSLALGATPWQTMMRVVLLTASPGIFSAIMIGFGRAVGETMIVLMATGNSPIMNFNIFEGMRTLSANVAVELPETAVGSSHYRVLFLAAVVLFIMTFFANTIAEIVRQRLRRRYSNL